MTAEEVDKAVDNALVQCKVCGGYVPDTHNYHNGMEVKEVGRVCDGCMMAASVFRGLPNEEATKLVTAYIDAKKRERAQVVPVHSICGHDGRPLPQDESNKFIMPPDEYAEWKHHKTEQKEG